MCSRVAIHSNPTVVRFRSNAATGANKNGAAWMIHAAPLVVDSGCYQAPPDGARLHHPSIR